MAEGFLQRRLSEAVADSLDGRVRIHSAGTQATLGRSPREVVSAAADFDVDLSGHRSRQLDAAQLGEADLVIGMSREHVRQAALIGAGAAAFARSFTLRELLRRAARSGGPRSGDRLAAWLAVVGAGRTTAELMGASRDDDITDPYGGPQRGYNASAVVIDDLVTSLALLLAPAVPR